MCKECDWREHDDTTFFVRDQCDCGNKKWIKVVSDTLQQIKFEHILYRCAKCDGLRAFEK